MHSRCPRSDRHPHLPARARTVIDTTRRAWLAGAGSGGALLLAPVWLQPARADDATWDEESTLKAAVAFFGQTTEGLAQVIARAFRDQGRPNGFIRGEEVSAALTAGVRYGEGVLALKNGQTRKLYWSGPSIGFDAGANAAKVFVLVYGLAEADAIFRRWPGVDGSVYAVGGAGLNYQRAGGATLAPVRLGIGWRAGASVGYTHYRREKSLMPL